jgi:general secretion pathway protein A
VYTEYWRLKEDPFTNSTDTRFVYMSEQHKEGLARLLYVAREHKSCAVLTGDYGTGKSLVRQLLLGELAKVGDFAIAVLDNPLVGADALLDDVLVQISERQPVSFSSRGAALRELREVFASRAKLGFHNLILVEDAHLLADRSSLEQLRQLMNLYDDRGQPLLSVMFFGHSSLDQVFAKSQALQQYISSSWFLEPFTGEQTREYVTRRLSVAGGNAWIFDDAAVAEIHRYTGGVARLINNLGDLALYLGMSENAVRVDASIVGRIIADIDKSTGKRGVE